MRTYIIVVVIIAGLMYAQKKYMGTFNPLQGTLEVATKHPDPVWSPRLEYWVAMVYYQKSDYGRAQSTFSKLLADYPTAQYAPKALIRLSMTAQETRDWATAKEALERYIEEYPTGKDIEMAKSTLDTLRYQHP